MQDRAKQDARRKNLVVQVHAASRRTFLRRLASLQADMITVLAKAGKGTPQEEVDKTRGSDDWKEMALQLARLVMNKTGTKP
jgi:hypothetical protein